MYHIHLTGVRNPIEVPTVKGDSIKKMLTDNSEADNFIEVNNRMFRLSAIKSFEYVSDNRSEKEPEPAPLPLTEEERATRDEIIAKTRLELEERGVLKNKDRSQDLRAFWKEQGLPVFDKCQVCGKELPKYLRRVCSGACYNQSPE